MTTDRFFTLRTLDEIAERARSAHSMPRQRRRR